MSKFFEENDEKIIEEKIEEIKPMSNNIPPEYLKVKLSSLGKLKIPAIIHIRDYNGEDALKLSMAPNDKLLRVLLNVLDKMIYEDIDVMQLHENELIEIMLNVYINFWSEYIKDYPYPVTDEEWEKFSEEKKKNLISGKESLLIDLNLNNIDTDLIKDDFQEPIKISNEKTKDALELCLPKLGHIIEAEDYIEQKYLVEEQKFQKIEMLLEYNNNLSIDEIDKRKDIDKNELKEYENYIMNKSIDLGILNHALSINKFNGQDIISLEDKIETYKKVNKGFWDSFIKIKEKYSDFGVNSDVKMKSPIDGKEVIRRCLFRLVEFVPHGKLQRNEGYVVNFGGK